MMTESKGEYIVNQGKASDEAHVSIEIDTTMDQVAGIMAWLQEQAQAGTIQQFTLTMNWSEVGPTI